METNFVMGVFEDFRYTGGQLTLERGDTLVLYTDGVTEAFNPKGEQFSVSGLLRVLKALPAAASEVKELVGTIVESVYAHAGDRI